MGDDALTAPLTALARQQLIRPERPEHAGEDALPLRARADPRGRLPRHGQAPACRAAREARRVAAGQARPGGRGPRLPPRARLRATAPSSGIPARRRARRGGDAAARERRPRRPAAWRPRRRRGAARARGCARAHRRPRPRRVAAGARRRAVRGGSARPTRSACWTRRSRRRSIRPPRRAPASSESWCASTPTPARGSSERARPRRGPRGAHRRPRPLPGLAPARLGRVDGEPGRTRRGGLAGGRRARAARRRRARAPRDPRLVHLGRVLRPDAGRRGDRAVHRDPSSACATARSRWRSRCVRSRSCGRSSATSPRRAA